jgi:hypothetical protein
VVTLILNESPNKEGNKDAERKALRVLHTSGHFCPYSPECVEWGFYEVR